MTTEAETSSQAALNPETSNPPISDSVNEDTSFFGSLKLWGKKVFSAMEYVGEAVAGVLGIDDSKFQWVMDGMSQEEWEAAQAVAAERQAQDAAAASVADITYTDPLVPPQETEMTCEQKAPDDGTTTENDITLQNV